MATTNPITNAEIKSSALSKQGRDNFDDIFAKRTIVEWAKIEGIYEDYMDEFEEKSFSYSEFLKLKQNGL